MSGSSFEWTYFAMSVIFQRFFNFPYVDEKGVSRDASEFVLSSLVGVLA